MKLSIVDIEHQGDKDKEVLTLAVNEDCNLKNFLITDSTVSDSETPSETFRHTFWFHPKEVKKGDYVYLYSCCGTDSDKKNNLDTMSHVYYWNCEHAVWHQADDAAVLLEVANWVAEKTRSFVSLV